MHSDVLIFENRLIGWRSQRTIKNLGTGQNSNQWKKYKIISFLTFPACFAIPIIFSKLNYNFSNLSDIRNLQEQVKKALYYQKLFWPFTVWINCSSDLKNFANSRPSPFKSFSRSLEQFFLTVGQNNFGNKIPFLNKIILLWKQFDLVLWKLRFCYKKVKKKKKT